MAALVIETMGQLVPDSRAGIAVICRVIPCWDPTARRLSTPAGKLTSFIGGSQIAFTVGVRVQSPRSRRFPIFAKFAGYSNFLRPLDIAEEIVPADIDGAVIAPLIGYPILRFLARPGKVFRSS